MVGFPVRRSIGICRSCRADCVCNTLADTCTITFVEPQPSTGCILDAAEEKPMSFGQRILTRLKRFTERLR